MAEIALVSDISGVCSNRETLRITNSPVNVAKRKHEQQRHIVRLRGFGPGGRRRRGQQKY